MHPLRNNTPPKGWERCTSHIPTESAPECVWHPRWKADNETTHWHPLHSSGALIPHLQHDLLPPAVEDGLLELLTNLDDAHDFEDMCEAKDRVRGYMKALVDAGLASSNHPIRLLL